MSERGDGPSRPTIRISSSPSARGPLGPLLRPPEPPSRREREEADADEKPQARLGLRLTVTAIVVLGLFTVMVGRLWSLQVLQNKKYKSAEVNTSTRTVQITPLRGLIFGREGQLLVSNKVEPVVTLGRTAVTQHPSVVPRLAALLGMTVAQVKAQINDDQYSPYEPVPVKVGVPMSVILYISEHRAQLPGVAVSYQSEREQPAGDVAPELLGFVGDITASEYKQLHSQGYQLSDVVGQFGVEKSYESWLRGKPGKQVLVVDPAGDVLGLKKTVAATPGDAVVLTLDLGLQHELANALARQIKALRAGSPGTAGVPADWGAAVVLDPQNGQVLAMVSSPSTQTYAISGLTPPGSTFKLASATAALDDGLILPYSEINDPGSFSLCSSGPGCIFYDSPGEAPAGLINVSKALAISDDVFFYNIGVDFFDDQAHYGKTPIQDVAAKYGLGEPTGIDIPGSAAGQVDSPALYNGSYYAGDALEMAFGQGATEVTALQVANMYATFANGGTRYAPQVVADVVAPDGKVVKTMQPQVLGTVSLPSATRSAILSGLEGAITYGTAEDAFKGFPLSSFQLAGKTGTATTNKTQPNGLFVAFGPVDDPQYVVAVVIDQAGYGVSAAAPVARQVFDYLLKHPVTAPVIPAHPAG